MIRSYRANNIQPWAPPQKETHHTKTRPAKPSATLPSNPNLPKRPPAAACLHVPGKGLPRIQAEPPCQQASSPQAYAGSPDNSNLHHSNAKLEKSKLTAGNSDLTDNQHMSKPDPLPNSSQAALRLSPPQSVLSPTFSEEQVPLDNNNLEYTTPLSPQESSLSLCPLLDGNQDMRDPDPLSNPPRAASSLSPPQPVSPSNPSQNDETQDTFDLLRASPPLFYPQLDGYLEPKMFELPSEEDSSYSLSNLGNDIQILNPHTQHDPAENDSRHDDQEFSCDEDSYDDSDSASTNSLDTSERKRDEYRKQANEYHRKKQLVKRSRYQPPDFSKKSLHEPDLQFLFRESTVEQRLHFLSWLFQAGINKCVPPDRVAVEHRRAWSKTEIDFLRKAKIDGLAFGTEVVPAFQRKFPWRTKSATRHMWQKLKGGRRV